MIGICPVRMAVVRICGWRLAEESFYPEAGSHEPLAHQREKYAPAGVFQLPAVAEGVADDLPHAFPVLCVDMKRKEKRQQIIAEGFSLSCRRRVVAGIGVIGENRWM